MPDGKTHRKIWKFFIPLPLLIGFAFSIIGYWYFSIFILLGYLLHGLGITNDLDLIGINSDEALWIKSVIFLPLILLSTLYARIIQKLGGHRSFLSHGYIISSVIRLAWFSLPFVLIFRHFFTDPLYIEFLGLLTGLSIADSIHTTADAIVGEMNFKGLKWMNNRLFKRIIKTLFGYPETKGKKKI